MQTKIPSNFFLSFTKKYSFSYYPNHRHKAKYYIDHKERKIDWNIHGYSKDIQEYLNRRWTRKNEIGYKLIK